MKNKVTLIVAFTLVLLSAKAQQLDGNFGNMVSNNNLVVVAGNSENTGEDVVGTPWLFEKWPAAHIYLTDGSTLKNVRVNVINQKGQLILEKLVDLRDIKYNIVEQLIDHFIIYDEDSKQKVKFRYMTPERFSGSLTTRGFFRVVASAGGVELLKYSQKDFFEAERKQAYSASSSSKYVLNEKYFLTKSDDEPYSEIRLRKKSFEKVLDETQAERAKKFMKDNGLNWGNEVDLLLMIEHLAENKNG